MPQKKTRKDKIKPKKAGPAAAHGGNNIVNIEPDLSRFGDTYGGRRPSKKGRSPFKPRTQPVAGTGNSHRRSTQPMRAR